MSKGEGLKIGIRFTEDLVGDVSGNEDAFSITGKEYQYVNGSLIDGNYLVNKVERYEIAPLWYLDDSLDLFEGETSVVEDIYDTTATNSYGSSMIKNNLVIFKSNCKITKIKLKTIASGTHTINVKTEYNGSTLATGSINGTTRGEWLEIALNTSIDVDINIKSNYCIEIIHPSGNSFVTSSPKYDGIIWASGGAYFGTWLGSSYTFAMGLVGETGEKTIVENKTVELQIQALGEYRIIWLEDKPIGTNITIEYTTGETQGQWQEVSNGEVISVNTNLWLRATLSTEDTAVTPILEDIWLEDTDVPQDKILITMDWWGRFNNVEDKIKVLYDASKGSLTGAGGAVESFEIEFTPEDLIQTPNPNAEELITAYPYEIVLDLNELTFINAYSQEYVKAYPYAISLTLTDVGEINP